MNTTADWLSAFPIQPATAAVEALRHAWFDLAKRPRTDFGPRTKEVALTKRIKVYIESYTARQRGLLGMWAAEDVIGDIDPVTGLMVEERRTDIVYGWNDQVQDLKLVFEFKRVGRGKRYRDRYLRESGLARFVTGIYSRRQAIAAMVGILLDPESEVVPSICAELTDRDLAHGLRLRHTPTGEPFSQPSLLFEAAAFDTEHEREPNLAPSHGYIRIAHFFFSFGYPTTTRRPGRNK